jgi:7,8-dihydro-6-hydroxymethylpterin-pyrophosphokinase
MARAFLGMGSNLGDRTEQLRDAVRSLADVVAVSPVYETAPVGGPEQGAYLNLVVELDTALDPRELLAECRRLGGAEHHDPDLEVPHPRMWQRRFVLAPLRDLAPDLVSDDALTAAEGDIRCLGPLWDPF